MTTEHYWRLRCDNCSTVYREVAETQSEVRWLARRNGWMRLTVIVGMSGYLRDLCPNCANLVDAIPVETPGGDHAIA